MKYIHLSIYLIFIMKKDYNFFQSKFYFKIFITKILKMKTPKIIIIKYIKINNTKDYDLN